MKGTEADWFALAARMEQLGGYIANNIKVHDAKGPGDHRIVAVLLFLRTLSHVRAILALLKLGCITEARTLTRNCFENMFLIAAIASQGAPVVSEMIENERKSQIARSELLIKNLAEVEETEWQDRVRKLVRELRGKPIGRTELAPKQIAGRGVMSRNYIFYSELSSDAAHPTTVSLSRHLTKSGDESNPDAFGAFLLDPLPRETEIRETLYYLGHALLGVFVQLDDVLGGIEGNTALAPIIEEFLTFAGEFGNSPDSGPPIPGATDGS